MEINQYIKNMSEIRGERNKNAEILMRGKYIERVAEMAKEYVVSDKLTVQTLAEIINETIAILGVHFTGEGDVSLLACQEEGVLTPYSHTLVMAVMGILIDNEIL